MNGNPTEDTADEISAYDLNEDGKVSLSESMRAKLGVVDARLEQIASEGGAVGKIAEIAHKVTDELDND